MRTPARAWIPGPSPHRSLGVVLAGDRGTPYGHDRVADELLDRPAVAGDHVAGQIEVAGQEIAGVLGIAPFGERGEADQIGEQDRHQTPLGHRRRARGAAGPWGGQWTGDGRDPGRSFRRRTEGLGAFAAEQITRLIRRSARRADDGERGCATGTELAPRLVLSSAA